MIHHKFTNGNTRREVTEINKPFGLSAIVVANEISFTSSYISMLRNIISLGNVTQYCYDFEAKEGQL